MKTLNTAAVMLFAVLISTSCAPGKAKKNQTIELAVEGWRTLAWAPIYNQAIRIFEKQHPGYKVKLCGYNQRSEILTRIAAGTAPDLLAWDDEPFLPLVQKNICLCLDEYIKQENFNYADLISQSRQIGTVHNSVYGIVYDGGTEVMFYNKDLFAARGVPLPRTDWTWDNMLAVARNLTATENGQKQYGISMHWCWVNWLSWIWCSSHKFF
ncbi:MAG TPA: hypothetical protein DC049_03490, partial [Spirochaetia bacterium]|nr:hypothetical protein [Spirochaetia bacterium]